jgi:ribosome-binding protein aMBF1 (putative translation factor)
MPPRIEFFERSELSTAQREYRDYSIRNVRNTYGNKNRNSTNDSDNPLIDDFNNFVEESRECLTLSWYTLAD